MSDKINGRTPEEIKKGLECGYCEDCSYREYRGRNCTGRSRADALALIWQLEERIVDLNKTSEQLERERDAAVNALCKIDEILIKHNFTGTHGCMNEVRKTINDSLIGIICSRTEVE